jgi:hypothetical protein
MKTPVATASSSNTETPPSVAGFQYMEDRLPPAAMPAKDDPWP